jgi:hypothetical protein
VLNVENQDEDLEDFKTCAVALAEENAKLKVLTDLRHLVLTSMEYNLSISLPIVPCLLFFLLNFS